MAHVSSIVDLAVFDVVAVASLVVTDVFFGSQLFGYKSWYIACFCFLFPSSLILLSNRCSCLELSEPL